MNILDELEQVFSTIQKRYHETAHVRDDDVIDIEVECIEEGKEFKVMHQYIDALKKAGFKAFAYSCNDSIGKFWALVEHV